MDNIRSTNEDLLDVARALLLLQGAILLATTIEALVWGTAFGGSAGPSFLLSAASAAIILVARVRLHPGQTWSRRLVYAVEGLILATLAIDAALAVALTQNLPPLVALLTRFVLPVSVIALLRRSSRAPRPTTDSPQLSLKWGS